MRCFQDMLAILILFTVLAVVTVGGIILAASDM
jgi:hypothetical protein